MKDTQPAAPAPTPRTDAVRIGPYKDFPYWEDFARQLERELTAAKAQPASCETAGKSNVEVAAKQPVPDALYEAIYNEVFILLRQVVGFAQDRGVVEMYTGRIMAALPAPTPATSEDTLRPSDSEADKWAMDAAKDIVNLWSLDKSDVEGIAGIIRDSAMAHAGEQKI